MSPEPCSATVHRSWAADLDLAEVGRAESVADAQRTLVEFYAGYGFEPAGEPYDWDGIEHVPMRRLKRELVS